jgi:HSP20 family protein
VAGAADTMVMSGSSKVQVWSEEASHMSLSRWSPRSGLGGFANDPFFRRFLTVFDDLDVSLDQPWHPRLDLIEEKDSLVVKVELPGIDPKSVRIDLQGEILTIQGERRVEKEVEGKRYLKREHLYGSFTRTVQLPYTVQTDKVKAQHLNGLLTITLPKSEEFVGRQIPVEIEK